MDQSNELQYTNKLFNALKLVKGNEKCFDCGKSPANWVNVENGIYICSKCSGIHRNLEDNKFTILSIYLDNLTNDEMNIMLCGGNKQLDEYLEKKEIDKNEIDFNNFYDLDILKEYRKELLLKSKKAKNKI